MAGRGASWKGGRAAQRVGGVLAAVGLAVFLAAVAIDEVRAGAAAVLLLSAGAAAFAAGGAVRRRRRVTR